MDRFFSKLDLRDIKIDPERTRFSPDDEISVEQYSEEVVDDRDQDRSPDQEIASVDDVSGHWTDEQVAGETDLDGAPPRANGHSNDVLKVSAKSRPSAVAGAIAGVVRENGRAEVQAIGAGATNQAIKAVAIARDYLQETGIDAICLPAFIDIIIENEDRTAMRLVIEPR